MKKNINLTEEEQKRILWIKILNEKIIFNINWHEFTFELPKDIITFIKEQWVWVRDFLDIKHSVWVRQIWNDKNIFNLKDSLNSTVKDWLYETIVEYSYEEFILNEFKIKETIKKILSNNNPHLTIYMSDLEIPKYWYLKTDFKIFWNFNWDKILKYEAPAIIEFLKNWKRKFQQEDYYKNFKLKYWINGENELKKWNLKELLKELKNLYINK